MSGRAVAKGSLALVALLLLSGISATAGASADWDCDKRVWVIGVRGSGETPNGEQGKVVGNFTWRLEKVAGKSVVGGEGLWYTGAKALEWWVISPLGAGIKKHQYDNSVKDGVESLVKTVKKRAVACKSQELVLSGYSQGAQVVREALPQLKDLAGHVGAVVLFGDTGFDPDSRADKGGGYNPKRHGVFGVPADFPREFDHVVTYCRDGDLVCQGAPNTFESHSHYVPGQTSAAVVKVADWLGLWQPPACTPVGSIAAIVDDSASMVRNDPEAIRRSALELLITKPSFQGKELGAVEFGSDAWSLFRPGLVATSSPGMLSALGSLANDGAADGGGSTDYNDAFEASGAVQSQAGARIFLTDGEHNEGAYENRHSGGPPTFVIGLNIGPGGQGSEEADLLNRIAAETGGRYFPLAQTPGEDMSVQLSRLQPAMNEIDALVSCQQIRVEQQQSFTATGETGAPVTAKFQQGQALEVVASWPAVGANLDLAAATARNPAGNVVGDLNGKRRIKGTKKRRAKLVVNRVEGETFETVTVQRPPGADSLTVRFGVAALAAPVGASIQIRSVAPGAPAGTTTAAAPPPPGTPRPAPTPAGGSGPTPNLPTEPVGGEPPPPPPPPRRVIVVDNRVTNGMGMREDATPARLTTQPWTFCTSRGCNIYGTERSSGGSYDAAVCQAGGERTTNGNDHDGSDDANPERFESARYYGVRLGDGTFGYVSEVWIRAADRGGLGLPAC